MQVFVATIIGFMPILLGKNIALGFAIGVFFCSFLFYISYYLPKKNRALSSIFSSDLFQNTTSYQGIFKFRKKILSSIKELQDYQIFIFQDDDIKIFTHQNLILNKDEKYQLKHIMYKALSNAIFINSEKIERFMPKNLRCYAYSYSLPFFNQHILILAYVSPHILWTPVLQEQIKSTNDTLSVIGFLIEVSGGNNGILELLKESAWESPYPIGACSPSGQMVFGNDALYQLFQGDVPNFKDLVGEEVFILLLNGDRVGQSFIYQGRRIRLEAFPLTNRNFLITKCLFVFYDAQVESKREMLGETNTLRRFTSGSSVIGAAMFTLNGIILYSNEAFMKSLDVYKVREATQKNIFDLFYLAAEEYQLLVKGVLAHQEQRVTLTGRENEQEFQVLFKGVIFGDKTIIEVVLEDTNIYHQNMTYLDRESQELHEELKTARSVQEHILTIPPIYRPGVAVDTLYVPSRQLSGDFFTIVPFEDDQMGILIADVSGHGVSASLITAALKILIELAPRDSNSLPKIISYFNTYLAGILPEGSFVTLFYGIIDFRENTLQYINCGHPFPILEDTARNEFKILEGMGYPLGGLLNVSFDDLIHTVQLPEKSKIILYTDGLLQHLQGTMKDKLVKIWNLLEKTKAVNGKELLKTLHRQLIARHSHIPQDDVSMMLISLDRLRTKKHHLYISSSILEVDTFINEIGTYIQQTAQLSKSQYWKIQTCFYEALLNAVVHGNKYNTQKKVYVEYRIVKGLVVIRIRDEGIGFDYRVVPNPLSAENILKDFGRGLTVLNTLADRVKFNEKGNEVTLFFRTPGVTE